MRDPSLASLPRKRRGLSIALAALLMAFPVVAADGSSDVEPPYPTALQGEFQVAPLRVGDAGVYSVSFAQDIGEGFEETGAPTEVLRFEWLADRIVASREHREVRTHVVRMQHDGWTRDEPGKRPEVEDVFVGLDGSQMAGAYGYGGGGSAGSTPIDRYSIRPDSEPPCMFRTPLADPGFMLANGSFEVDCDLRGVRLDGDYRPFARSAYGPLEAVVFHRARDVHQGEVWVWFAPEVSAPLAFVVQDANMPMRFMVVRLTAFASGSDALEWVPAPGEPWPALPSGSWGRFGPPDPPGMALGPRAALSAVLNHTDGQPVVSWLASHPSGLAEQVRSDGLDIEGGTATRRYQFMFREGTSRLHVDFRRTTSAEPLPAIVYGLAGLPANATQDTVTVTAETLEGDAVAFPPGFQGMALPLPLGVAERWQALRGTGYQQAPTNLLSWSRFCRDDCTHVDATIQLGHETTDDQRSAGGAYTYSWSGLWVSDQVTDQAGPSGWPSMSLDEVRSATVAVPAQGGLLDFGGYASAVSLVRDVLESAGLAGSEAATGAPGAAPSVVAPTGLPADQPEAQRTADGAAANLPDGLPLVVVGPATAAALAGAAWLAWKLVGAALFSRIARNRLLEHPVRAQLHALVEAQPGIHFKALLRATQREHGVVAHHLRKLVAGGILLETTSAQVTTYHTANVPQAVRAASAAVALPTRRAVLAAVADQPGASPMAVARSVGIAPATVTHHIQRLEAAGLLTIARQAGAVRLMPTPLATQCLARVRREVA